LSKLSQENPTGRFTGLAEIYADARPGYPPAGLDFIVGHCGLSRESLVVDVGAGTGIFARLLALRGVPVIGIEPNADMRARAEAEPFPQELPAPEYRPGRAEATLLPAKITDAVLAAQAFHWFEPDAALAEFYRILKPGGWVVLVWNERDEADAFTAAYGAVIRSSPGAAAVEGPRAKAGDALRGDRRFEQAERVRFPNEQELDEEGVLRRAFSASYAPREPQAVAAFKAKLRQVFGRFQKAGRVTLSYETSVYVARKPAR
jgi:SAM-dependent methyltransferase